MAAPSFEAGWIYSIVRQKERRVKELRGAKLAFDRCQAQRYGTHGLIVALAVLGYMLQLRKRKVLT